MARSALDHLAHALGRSADYLRRHKKSVTAIERLEALERKREALDQKWNKSMYETQRRGERRA